MSNVWDIVQRHIDAYGVREAEIARRMGTVPQTLNSWKNRGIHKLPDARLLLALANITGVAYEDVLNAALHDIRYLPREVVGSAEQPAPNTPAGKTPASTSRLLRPRQQPASLEADQQPPTDAPRDRLDSPPRQAEGQGR
jgi:transcriptional regulator with XRE-family HTH domain